MKAIQTIYKGRRFRSRLEAKWAIFFDAIDVGWEYETEGFEIGTVKYLTDFKLSSFGKNKVDLFIEIKPNRPSEQEILKCYKVATSTGTDMVMICGTPGLPEFSDISDNWNLKSGYIAIHFPAVMSFKTGDEPTPFDVWKSTCRFSLFQTFHDGYDLDIGPIYFYLNEDDNIVSYNALSEINEEINQNFKLYGLTPFGKFIPSQYFSSGSGRTMVHDRLIYGYQIATGARFEHDEFNQKIVERFYNELDLIPFKRVYKSEENSYSLYFDTAKKIFVSRKSKESKPDNTFCLIREAPKLVIKQFVVNFPENNRTDDKEKIRQLWNGFLFRYGLRQKGMQLKRKIT